MRWATSVPILVFLGLSVLELGPMKATDWRQTSDKIASCVRSYQSMVNPSYVPLCAQHLLQRPVSRRTCVSWDQNVKPLTPASDSWNLNAEITKTMQLWFKFGHDLWTFWPWKWCSSDVGYLCANFSLPRPLSSRLRPDVCDRQTDVRHASSLNASALWGRRHNNNGRLRKFSEVSCTEDDMCHASALSSYQTLNHIVVV